MQYHNWFFGDSAGITFNTPNLLPLAVTTSSIYALEGCCTISDKSGKLLFYSNGQQVWNRNHKIMPHGDSLAGAESSAQACLIVPQPMTNKYYLFTTDVINFAHGLQYSIIDMDSAGGLGDVTTKNVNISLSMCEKLACTKHANKRDFWIIARLYKSPLFISILLTQKGIESKIYSNVTQIIDHSGFSAGEGNLDGVLKISPDGNKIVSMNEPLNFFELFDFDNLTGDIYNTVKLSDSTLFETGYGAEFSPDGTQLYTTLKSTDAGWGLYQFDITGNSAQDIINSAGLIFSGCQGALQLGPDRKIYAIGSSAYNSKGYLGVISNPDNLGKACNYTDTGVYLGGREARWGLPNIISDAFTRKASINIKEPVCEGDTIFLISDISGEIPPDSVSWTGPKGYTSNLFNPFLANVNSGDNGIYFLKVYYPDIILSDSISVIVTQYPDFIINPPNINTICQGDSLLLFILPGDYFKYHYYWSNGDTTYSTYAKKDGMYYISVETIYGCRKVDSVFVTVVSKPSAKIIADPDTIICAGAPLILTAKPDGYRYIWNNGDTAQSINVTKSGKYTVRVKNKNNCDSLAEISIKVINSINTKIVSDKGTDICSGDSLTLSANPNSSYYKYLWSTNEKTKDIIVNKPGKYYVTVSFGTSCIGMDSIFISEFPVPEFNINGYNVICTGDSVVLSVDRVFKHYQWSTGDTTKSILIRKPGKYTVSIVDLNGCRNSKTYYVDQRELNIYLKPIKLVFDSTCTGEQTIADFIISNHEQFPIGIQSISIKNRFDVFKILGITTPYTLKQGEFIPIQIEFNPKEINYYYDSLIIQVDEPCAYNIFTDISAAGTAHVSIWIPDTTGTVGDGKFNIPIFAKLLCGGNLISNVAYNTDINFDATLFLPDGFNNPEIIANNILNGIRILKYNGNFKKISNNNSIIGNILGEINLADSNRTSVTLSGFIFNNPLLIPEIKDGSLTVKGLCQLQLNRIKMLNMPDFILSPIPANDELDISFNNIQSENGLLNIYSLPGENLMSASIDKKIKESGIKLNISNLATGQYIVILNIDNTLIIKELIILK